MSGAAGVRQCGAAASPPARTTGCDWCDQSDIHLALRTALDVLERLAEANIDLPATPREFEILAAARATLDGGDRS